MKADPGTTRYPNGHVVAAISRLRCGCGQLATRCEHMHWSARDGRPGSITLPGVSFFYFCDRCWITVGPDGTSPRDRASKAVST